MEVLENEKYNWKLTDLFDTVDDFMKEVKTIKDLLKKLEEYKTKLCDNAENLYNVYNLYENILIKFDRVYSYGMFNYHLNMTSQNGIKLFKEVESLSTEFMTASSFIVPEISYADEEIIRNYLVQNPNLKRYKREIEEILDQKKHVLSNEQEQLLANYSEVFSGAENIYDMLTNAEFKFGTIIDENGKKVELTDAKYSKYMSSLNRNVRKQAFEKMYEKYSSYINTITEIYLTNVKTDTITSKLRNYKSSLEKAVINDDSSILAYETLMKGVENSLDVNHKFIALKKELLNLKDFHMYDLYVNPFNEEDEEITFEEGKEQVLEALAILGEEYTNKLKEAFDNNWIDVYEKENKKGGAYSSGVYGVHPFILMSFTNNKRDVSTIAHELGHSMHSYYSSTEQNIIDSNYTIMVAEVASTVNEILFSEYQIKNEKNIKKKAKLIYELLEMIRATFFRQSMFAEFEKEIHSKIENNEMLSSENCNEIYYELNKKYFGNNIIIDESIKYEWARIPHFYSNFYVYKYATGITSAICIATKILNNEEGFVEKYINMLKLGCTKKSLELLKLVDVDLENIETYEVVKNYYNNKIEELKKLNERIKDGE